MIHLLPILRRLYYTTLRRNLGSSLVGLLPGSYWSTPFFALYYVFRPLKLSLSLSLYFT